MAVLHCLRHIWNIINKLRDDKPNKYEISNKERFLLGLSISYIIVSIINGTQI